MYICVEIATQQKICRVYFSPQIVVVSPRQSLHYAKYLVSPGVALSEHTKYTTSLGNSNFSKCYHTKY